VKQILDHPECWVLLNADQTISQAEFSPSLSSSQRPATAVALQAS